MKKLGLKVMVLILVVVLFMVSISNAEDLVSTADAKEVEASIPTSGANGEVNKGGKVVESIQPKEISVCQGVIIKFARRSARIPKVSSDMEKNVNALLTDLDKSLIFVKVYVIMDAVGTAKVNKRIATKRADNLAKWVKSKYPMLKISEIVIADSKNIDLIGSGVLEVLSFEGAPYDPAKEQAKKINATLENSRRDREDIKDIKNKIADLATKGLTVKVENNVYDEKLNQLHQNDQVLKNMLYIIGNQTYITKFIVIVIIISILIYFILLQFIPSDNKPSDDPKLAEAKKDDKDETSVNLIPGVISPESSNSAKDEKVISLIRKATNFSEEKVVDETVTISVPMPKKEVVEHSVVIEKKDNINGRSSFVSPVREGVKISLMTDLKRLLSEDLKLYYQYEARSNFFTRWFWKMFNDKKKNFIKGERHERIRSLLSEGIIKVVEKDALKSPEKETPTPKQIALYEKAPDPRRNDGVIEMSNEVSPKELPTIEEVNIKVQEPGKDEK